MGRLSLAYSDGAELLIDYEDRSRRVTGVVCNNATPFLYYGAIWHPSTGQLYSATFPANQTTNIPIPRGDNFPCKVDSEGGLTVDTWTFDRL